MQPNEAMAADMFYLLSSTPNNQNPPNFLLHDNINLRHPNPFYNLNTVLPHVQNHINLQQPCFNNNYYYCINSDEADDQELSSIIHERKRRRMISNRESARRSRIRKLKHLDELWSQVVLLKNENHQLMDKVKHVTESHDRVVRENAQLKEDAFELRQMLADLQINNNNHDFPLSDDY